MGSILPIVGFFTLSIITSFSLAYLEGKRNNFRLFGKTHVLGLIGAAVSVLTSVGFLYLFFSSNKVLTNEIIYGLIASRTVLAVLAAKVAIDNRRSMFAWFTIALIEPTFSILAISTLPGLIRSSNMFSREIKFINQKCIENINTIKKLRESELLSKEDFEKKQTDLKLKYEMQMQMILANQEEKMMKIEQKNLLNKLEAAYSSGVLTKEEFTVKKEQLLKNLSEITEKSLSNLD